MNEKKPIPPENLVPEATEFVDNTWGAGSQSKIVEQAQTDPSAHAVVILGCSAAYEAENTERTHQQQRKLLIEKGKRIVKKFGPNIIPSLKEAGYPYIEELLKELPGE